MLGFGGAALGPLVFGWTLDVSGGQGMIGWWAAFMHMGLVQIAGIAILIMLKPPSVGGDRK